MVLPAPGRSLLLFDFAGNLVRSFTGVNLLFHLAAMAATFVLVRSGADWAYYRFVHDSRALQVLAGPAVPMGGLGPVLLIVILFLRGRRGGSDRLVLTAYAMVQTVLASLIITSIYKAVTGRLAPVGPELFDYSMHFQFGLLRAGIFDGWPSGHATTAFAIVALLAQLYPHRTRLIYAAFGIAAYIDIGVSMNIHWLSDAVAGALIGCAIGTCIGKSYRRLQG